MTDKLSSWRAVGLAMRSWRTAAVSLLSFSSGLPLGLVWIAIPTWLARLDVDIKIIGLFTLAQAPWSFKFLWSPLMDRYALPLPRLGQKLGWTLTLGRSANLTKPLNGRQPCHYCGPCERGCATHSYFNSAFTTVADALKTGNCTLVQNAMVYKVLMDKDTHRARGDGDRSEPGARGRGEVAVVRLVHGRESRLRSAPP